MLKTYVRHVMKNINIVLSDSAHQKVAKIAQKHGIELGQYCSALLADLVEQEPPAAPSPVSQAPGIEEKIKEMDLVSEILACLKSNGGSAQKVDVEKAVFEKFKSAFETPYYQELVGGGVARWRKNVQFARNTARNMGLIKAPDESGRGVWELTPKGAHWKFD
jgi:hypothetical protein